MTLSTDQAPSGAGGQDVAPTDPIVTCDPSVPPLGTPLPATPEATEGAAMPAPASLDKPLPRKVEEAPVAPSGETVVSFSVPEASMSAVPVAAVEAPEAQDTPEVEEARLPLFSDFGLHPDILRAVTEAGYTRPTPIQAAAIPVVMSGKDVMAAAQTGTGKTAGFSLPIINMLMPLANTSASPARHPVRALIIAPTRELADQIHDNVKVYTRFTPLRSAAVFGGVDIQPQTMALRQGVEILIATPGRLLDHVQQKSVNLSQVQLLVLDEADRMLDMGFLPDIQRIINLLAPKRQNLMFSATFSDEIRKLAKRFLNQPQLIEVARPNTLAENVEQTVYRVEAEELKREAVAWLIRERQIEQVIVFSNTKIGAGRLARQLQKEGLQAEAIHGDKSQQERLQTLDGFKSGSIKVLVATDVAARGLDIAELPAVINYDLPHSPEDYVHRIGRTGRAGASGMALSLMSARDQKALAEIEKLTKRSLKVEELASSVICPASARGRSRDRDGEERASRRGRGDRAEGGHGRHAGGRHEDRYPARRAAPRPVADDPLFHAPYVPAPAPAGDGAAVAGGASAQATAHTSAVRQPQPGVSRATRRPARKLAVLLGGAG
ncbi:MAG: DEAD/DEAH box helicase [Lautropia sp.]|nr:DEAD/DEAH box helicase [Lautropia sp.]